MKDSPPNTSSLNSKSDTDEIDLIELAARLWKHRWLGIAFVFSFLCLAALYLHNATYQYTAALILTPADQAGSKLPGNLSGLGSLVGIDLGGQQDSGFSLYAEAIQSYPVAERLSQDPKIMRTLFSGAWDESASRWREPSSSLKPVIRTIKDIFGVPSRAWQPPSAQDLQQYISQNVGIAEGKKKPTLTLTYQDENQEFARYFLAQINSAADNFLRRKSLLRAALYIDYLERRIRTTQIAEYRLSLYDELRYYEKIRMMASSRTSFAADAFGDVMVSQRPTSPKPTIVILLSIFLGVFVWVCYVLILKPAFELFRSRMASQRASAV